MSTTTSHGTVPQPVPFDAASNASTSLLGNKPSQFYRTELWRLGLFAARSLPASGSTRLARYMARVYMALNPSRRKVVSQNLLPALAGDGARAASLSRELFANFGEKI